MRITVSRSVATTLSLFFSTSNKKSSRMGSTVLVLITPAICCSCLSNAEEDTINFIYIIEWAKLLIFELHTRTRIPQFMPGNQLPSAVIFLPQSVGSPRFFGRIADFYNPPKESGYMQKQTLTKEQAMQKLRHFCAYQERCHSEVRERLFSLGVWMRDHDEIIAGLIEDNYLNEERFAIQYAGGHYRMKQWGRVKIKYALKQKGVSEYCI